MSDKKTLNDWLGFESDSFSSLLSPPPSIPALSAPQEIDISLIDEDPNQPRTKKNGGFLEKSIEEIGLSIKERGVKSPISLRPNPKTPGRFLINHGARRFRGSLWAGKKTIPAFIDKNYEKVDQIIENVQREALGAREIASFIDARLKEGHKKGDIARSIGKSAAFVTQHLSLLEAPRPVLEAFIEGRVRDLTVVSSLATAWKKNPEKVSLFLSEQSRAINRSSAQLLREFTEKENSAISQQDRAPVLDGILQQSAESEIVSKTGKGRKPLFTASPSTTTAPNTNTSGAFDHVVLRVLYKETEGALLLEKSGKQENLGIFRNDNGEETEVPLLALRLVSLRQKKT